MRGIFFVSHIIINGERMKILESYNVPELQPSDCVVNLEEVLSALIRSYSKLQVYKNVIKTSRMDKRLFLPALQTKEALASATIEGAQITIEDAYDYKMKDKAPNQHAQELLNSYDAITYGYTYLQSGQVDISFFNELHKKLLSGDVRKNDDDTFGLRTKQNKVKNSITGQVTYIPPKPEHVEKLMNNLLAYIDYHTEDYIELVRIAIIHAQFESIHPYMDGNGRVGRLFVPLYLYYKKVIPTPYFFISDALESEKNRYYKYLSNTRTNGNWKDWILFFLEVVEKQCDKYIQMIQDINALYERDLSFFADAFKAERGERLLKLLFKCPVINSNRMMEKLQLPRNTVLRYLKVLEDNNILVSDEKGRNATYYYYELLSLLK